MNRTPLAGLRLARTYATRRPERPPPRRRDPLADVEGLKVAPNLTFFHRPPPSAPTPESLTSAPSSPLLRPPTQSNAPKLPPPMRGTLPEEKKQHLTEIDMNEIRRLRAADPVNNTRGKLAKQFNTSSWFISTVSRVPKDRKVALDAKLDAVREKWGERKRLSVEVRKKRREFW
ncbi:mitochondrial ribosomal protein subunit L20-domain-containing protein [Auriculariales sp. MPI-PUGE-AT-0066]|nr:mitochondrial ribosomal protein subunit L20-domain-containing protein [Auriculariales sp. MPI-PUGE-AT-0066]